MCYGNRRQFLKTTTAAVMMLSAGCLGGNDGSGTTWIMSTSNEGSPVIVWQEGFASVVNENSNTLEVQPQNVNGWRTASVRLTQQEYDISAFSGFFIPQIHQNAAPYSNDGDIGSIDEGNIPQCIHPTMHEQNMAFFVREDSDIETFEDMDGEIIGNNVRGSSVIAMGNIIRETANEVLDINWQWEPLSWSDYGTAMQEGRLEAGFALFTNGNALPAPLVQAFEAADFTGLDIPDEVDAELEDHPFLDFGTINGDDLNVSNNIGEIRATDVGSSLFVHPSANEDLVYEFVSLTVGNQDEMAQFDQRALSVWGVGEDRRGFTGLPSEDFQFHPGAVEYFEEEDIDYPGR